jgi:uncharacterized membrane protein YfcA
MALDVPAAELVWLISAIVVAGIATGILAGLFGIGGGAILVPVLYEAFRLLEVPEAVRMQLCIGTSLAIIVPTQIRSYRVHRAKGFVIEEVVRQWAVPAVLGVAVGALTAALAPPVVFKLAFAAIAGFIAGKLLFGRDRWQLATALPGRAAMSGYGFLVGLCSSLIGISGGSVVNLVLALYGKPIHNAVATAAGIGVPVAVAGAIGYALAGLRHQALLPPLSIGFVSLVGFAVIAPLSTLTAPYGAQLAHRASKRALEVAFGLFLLLASVRFAASVIW